MEFVCHGNMKLYCYYYCYCLLLFVVYYCLLFIIVCCLLLFVIVCCLLLFVVYYCLLLFVVYYCLLLLLFIIRCYLISFKGYSQTQISTLSQSQHVNKISGIINKTRLFSQANIRWVWSLMGVVLLIIMNMYIIPDLLIRG